MLAVTTAQTLDLKSASTHGLFATGSISNTSLSVVNGDIGVSGPAASVTGSPPGVVIGKISISDSDAQAAQNDIFVAYGQLQGLPCGTDLSGQDLGTLSEAATFGGTLTLDAGGNPNARFAFQIAGLLGRWKQHPRRRWCW